MSTLSGAQGDTILVGLVVRPSPNLTGAINLHFYCSGISQAFGFCCSTKIIKQKRYTYYSSII